MELMAERAVLFYLDGTRRDVRPFCAELIARGGLNTAKDALAPRRPAPPHRAALGSPGGFAARRPAVVYPAVGADLFPLDADSACPSSGAQAYAATWRISNTSAPESPSTPKRGSPA
jgi:hypothetical protein